MRLALSLLLVTLPVLAEEQTVRDKAVEVARKVEKDVGVELRKARDGARRLIKKEDQEKAEEKKEDSKSN